jgi:hypothetical protein
MEPQLAATLGVLDFKALFRGVVAFLEASPIENFPILFT